jgi:hypothetical protein
MRRFFWSAVAGNCTGSAGFLGLAIELPRLVTFLASAERLFGNAISNQVGMSIEKRFLLYDSQSVWELPSSTKLRGRRG